MHGIVETLNRWGAEATTLAVMAVWQSTIVAALVAVAALAWRRHSPAVRYWLWQIVAIKLLLMPFWSWTLAVPWLPAEKPDFFAAPPALPRAERLARDGAGPTAPAIHNASDGAPQTSPAGLTWRGWLLVGWAAIVAAQVARLGVQRVRLGKLLGQCEAAPEGLVQAVDRVAQRLKLQRAPRVLTGELACSPFVCGIAEPKLVVPRELADTIGADDLEQIVAHELAHVKRHDLAWGWIPQLACVLFFFHPVAYLASRQIRLERELACDQWALADSGRRPAEYAETLVRVLGAVSRPSTLGTSAGLDGGEQGKSS